MNPTYSYRRALFLYVLIMATNISSGQAQPKKPQVVPIPSQVQLMQDQQSVQELSAFANRYSAQVDEYVIEVKNEIETIDSQKLEYLKQIQSLEKKFQQTPQLASVGKTDLANLHTRIHEGDLRKQQGIQNINTALAWVNYVRQQLNNLKYSITQDQQQVAVDLQLQRDVMEQQRQIEGLRKMEANQPNSTYSAPGYDDYDYGNGASGNRVPNTRFNNRNNNSAAGGGGSTPGGVGEGMRGEGARGGGGGAARSGGGGRR